MLKVIGAIMSLSPTEITKLKKLISLAQELLATAEPTMKRAAKGTKSEAAKRTRRSGKELVAFRKMLRAERKKGVPVEELAQTHGISTTYIYTLGK
jgi:hypothetical protein